MSFIVIVFYACRLCVLAFWWMIITWSHEVQLW